MTTKLRLAVWTAVAALVAGSLTAIPAAAAPAAGPATSGYGTITGKATYAGKALANASIGVFAAWSPGAASYPEYYAQTDPSGAFLIEQLPAGKKYAVAVLANGYESYLQTFAGKTVRHPDATVYTVKADATVPTSTIAAIAGGTITGKVVTSSGKAVKGAFVSAYSTQRQGSSYTTTNAKGVYVLKGLPAGPANVSAYRSSGKKTLSGTLGGDKKPTALSVKAGKSVKAKNLTIKSQVVATGTVTGTVRTSKSTGSGEVTLLPVSLAANYGGPSGKPSAKGKVTIKNVPVGTYDVVVQGTTAVKRITVKKGKKASFGTVKLGKAGTVKGKLALTSGKAAVGGYVTVTDSKGRYFGSTDVSAKGAYTIKGLGAGTYRLTGSQPWDPALSKGQAPTTVTIKVKAGKTLKKNVKLTKQSTIAGVVKNAKGKAVAGIWVSAYSTNGTGGSVVTDAKGRFTVPNLGKGSYTVTMNDPYEGGYRNAVGNKGKLVKVSKAGKKFTIKTVAVK